MKTLREIGIRPKYHAVRCRFNRDDNRAGRRANSSNRPSDHFFDLYWGRRELPLPLWLSGRKVEGRPMSQPPPPQPRTFVGPRSFLPGEKLYGRDREIEKLKDRPAPSHVVCSKRFQRGQNLVIQAGLPPRLSEDEEFLVLRVRGEPAPRYQP